MSLGVAGGGEKYTNDDNEDENEVVKFAPPSEQCLVSKDYSNPSTHPVTSVRSSAQQCYNQEM